MPTPIYDALRAYAGGRPARFHMPGHKGSYPLAEEFDALAARIDALTQTGKQVKKEDANNG